MGVICLGKICNITYIRHSGEIGIGKISGEFCSKREEIVGYRLYEREAGSIRDIKVNDLIKSLKDGAKVENLALDNNGDIRFTAGDESRYSLIYGNETMGCGNIIVLAKIIGTDKYKVTDSSGVTYYMSTKEIISKHSGLANVKIVYKNNKCFISAINGTLPEENIKINNRKRFVMLYYKGTKNSLSKAYGYYCYNLETNKIYNKSKMKRFREQEMSMTTVESLCRKGNNILSLNQDIEAYVYKL